MQKILENIQEKFGNSVIHFSSKGLEHASNISAPKKCKLNTSFQHKINQQIGWLKQSSYKAYKAILQQ